MVKHLEGKIHSEGPLLTLKVRCITKAQTVALLMQLYCEQMSLHRCLIQQSRLTMIAQKNR